MSDHSPTDHDRLVRHQRVLEIFQRACDLQSPQRDAVLDVECAGDADLRSRVEALLRADSAPDHLFDKPATLAGALWPSNQPLEALAAPPDHIGRYRLIGLIGSGGMGDVYEAQQESPKRSVALKVMHRWTNDVSGLAARFEQEGEIQASLAHPGIAQVYESGAVHHAGRRVHFIAMELVAGVPLR